MYVNYIVLQYTRIKVVEEIKNVGSIFENLGEKERIVKSLEGGVESKVF